MIANGKELFKLVDDILKPREYVGKKDIWYYFASECICYFTLRKSELGGFYDAGMGCFLKEIYTEKDEFPKLRNRHLFYPIENLVGRDTIRSAFDMENQGFLKNEREELITRLLNKYIIPFLTELSTKEGIKRAMVKYPDLKYYAWVNLLPALNMKIDA